MQNGRYVVIFCLKLSGIQKWKTKIRLLYIQVMIKDLVKIMIFDKLVARRSRFLWNSLHFIVALKLFIIDNHYASIINWQIFVRRSGEDIKSIGIPFWRNFFHRIWKQRFEKYVFKESWLHKVRKFSHIHISKISCRINHFSENILKYIYIRYSCKTKKRFFWNTQEIIL